MNPPCVECGEEARFLCGHGCMTVYCGESCAQNAYISHKVECAVLIGGSSGEEILRRVNYGSPAQRYQNLYSQFELLKQDMTRHMNMNWVQNRWNKAAVTAHVQSFLYVADILYKQPDMSAQRAQILNLINWVHQYQPLMIRSQLQEEVGELSEINEGAVDVLRDENAFYNYFNRNDASHRQNVIQTTFAELEATYEKNSKSYVLKKMSGLKNKLKHFKNALDRITKENKDIKDIVKRLSDDEARRYPKYIQQVDAWLATL